MQGQIFKLFRGMFSLNLMDKREQKYWSEQWGITPEQVHEASEIAHSQSINGIRQALYKLGYFKLPEWID